MENIVITRRWHTVGEVAEMLGFGVSKVKMLVISGEIRSVKVGRNRRILPQAVDEYVARCAAAEEEVPW
jgi:excisionase family DNA binding protein